jgi:hypothetical protein
VKNAVSYKEGEEWNHTKLEFSTMVIMIHT